MATKTTSKTTKKAKTSASPTRKKAVKKTTRKAPATRRKAAVTTGLPVLSLPQPRHAVFVDVENTNSEQGLFDVLDALAVDRRARTTELVAVGNWRAVGQQLARRLGTLGAQLVHSAPARGVRDWSDLWIAVAAGCWLGQARPGDILEIISNDRAFDAVGDAAASRGVVYRRLQHRRDVATAAPSEQAKRSPEEAKRPRRSRGGRRRRRGRPATTPPPIVAVAPSPAPAPAQAAVEPHAASREQVIDTIGQLTNNQSGRWVNLDVLEKALKDQGFSRPPGSPRLVTRLRALKDVEVDSHGRARLTTEAAAAAD